MSTTEAVGKETKAQIVERLKREKNPWEALEEIRSFAKNDRGALPPEWAGTYFKWWGIYTQGDGQGAAGGKGGVGNATPFFMLRVGLPNGFVNSQQLRLIGKLSQEYAQNKVQITTRQTLQFHWVTLAAIPEIIDALHTVGLTPKGASGDVLRGITGCPLAGCLQDELIDASPIVAAVHRELSSNSNYYNLPRKIKVTVTGCPIWCSHPEINDLAFTAATHNNEVGFSLRFGGGLSREPHLATRLNAFVQPAQVVDVVRATMELFKQQNILREKREQARLKHLILKQGWTETKVLEEIEKILGYRLAPATPEHVPLLTTRDHLGIHPQKQPGKDYVGAAVLCGGLSGDQLLALSQLAEQYGSGEIRFTATQNLILPNIEREQSMALAKELENLGLNVEGSVFRCGAVACTGTEFCKLGIAETKSFTAGLVRELEDRLPNFREGIKINVTGCGNGCAHHHVSDIGLEGRKIKQNGKMVDGFSFFLGGGLGKDHALSRSIGYRCPAAEAPDAIERLLLAYAEKRKERENLHAFLTRSSNAELQAILAGQQTEAASTQGEQA